MKKSVNPPQFEKMEYEGFISADAGVDSMVLESKASNRPLKVQAKDTDYADVRSMGLFPCVGSSENILHM